MVLSLVPLSSETERASRLGGLQWLTARRAMKREFGDDRHG
jgi:hypothetical protein